MMAFQSEIWKRLCLILPFRRLASVAFRRLHRKHSPDTMFANAMAVSLRVNPDHLFVGCSVEQLVPSMAFPTLAFPTLALASIFVARAL